MGTYFDDDQTYVRVTRFKTGMTIANVVVLLLIVAISIMLDLGARSLLKGGKQLFFVIGNYSSLAFQTICTLVWGWTLFSLYRDVNTSDKLLPNKKLFILHGSLLATYLFLYLLQILIAQISFRA